MTSTIKEHLIAARALIDTPEKWLPGWLNSPVEGRYAVDQAIRAVAVDGNDQLGRMANACSSLDEAVPENFVLDQHSGLREYIQYVDRFAPTHADIMALFDRAIAAQETSHAG